MDRSEQQPIGPSAGPDDMNKESSRTATGGWRVTGDIFSTEDSPHGPATAAEFLSSLGLGEAAPSAITEEEDGGFGPTSGSEAGASIGQTGAYSAPGSNMFVRPNQFATSASVEEGEEDTQLVFGDTIRAADETDTSTETEEVVEEAAPAELSDTEQQTPPAPPAEEEDEDFGDPLALEAQQAKKRGHFDGLQPIQPTRDADQAGLPGSVVRRRPNTEPRWRRRIEEE